VAAGTTGDAEISRRRAAKAWYDSERYRAARSMRSGATLLLNMVVVEGVSAPV